MSFIITVQGYVGLESLPTAQFPVREELAGEHN